MGQHLNKHKRIEELAYRLWEERGRPLGSPEEDWFRAEEFLQRRSSPMGLPLAALMVEPFEY